ncbi:YdcF family protein [Scleromatobacter humisilvae]|uniref:YdcF family protein n=1 Tax=Scleromatobacter humisilvae TaxID=2897159 RepID=A0A9X1YNU7_9BURK|nr:YdcF family protein [Scleromatobacter humisilvae]MCK9687847.1 YdcF family protein [Scleromatobacter humisilvae]
MFADWLTSTGLGAVKPVVSALLLPPTPFIIVALAGVAIARARPRTGRALIVISCVSIWLTACMGFALWLETAGLDEPTPLDATARAGLKAREAAGEPLAIVVLGGGVDQVAPEYGAVNLGKDAYERLRYAVWLNHQTSIPILASGGRGWGAPGASNPPEATRTSEIAQSELGTPLRWTESNSRDTHENAVNSVAMLQAAGIREIVLVTHGFHMPRALHEFRAAAAAASASAPMRIIPATMGQAGGAGLPLLHWMPSDAGLQRTRNVWHEILGGLVARRRAPTNDEAPSTGR